MPRSPEQFNNPQLESDSSSKKWRGWEKKTTGWTSFIDMIFNNRGLEVYLKELGLDVEQLRGKRILDLGSSKKETFARQVAQKKIEAEVISINPDLVFKKYRKALKKLPDWTHKSIAAVAQELPISSESIDWVLGIYSVPMHLPTKEGFFSVDINPEAVRRFLFEVARVLRPGGQAIFFPVPVEGPTFDAINPVLEELNKQSIQSRFDVPPLPLKDAHTFKVLNSLLVLSKIKAEDLG